MFLSSSATLGSPSYRVSMMRHVSVMSFRCTSVPLLLWWATMDVALSISQVGVHSSVSIGKLPKATAHLQAKQHLARDIPPPSNIYYDKSNDIIPLGQYPWDPEPPEHDFIRYPQSRVLVAPKYKLAFCYMEKNACTEFNSLFNRLNDIQVEDEDEPWWQATAGYQNISLSALTSANGWKWGVFLRDPAARYLSAWGSKCLQKEENGWNCRPGTDGLLDKASSPEFQVLSFEDATRRNHENQSRLFDNPHWAKQSQFCQGFHDLSRFDFVGLLEKDVNSQVHQMLHQAHIWDMDSAVDKYFPKAHVHGHSSHLNESLFFKSPETVRLIHEMYRDDFKLMERIPQSRSTFRKPMLRATLLISIVLCYL